MAQPKRKRWTGHEEAELVRLSKTGLSEIDISRRLDRTVIAIKLRVDKLKRAGRKVEAATK